MALTCVNGVRECWGCLWCLGEPAWPEEEVKTVYTKEKKPKPVGRQSSRVNQEKKIQKLQHTLKRLDELRENLARAMRCLDTMEEEGVRATTCLSHMRYNCGTRSSRVEHAVITRLDLEREIRELIAEEELLLEWLSPMVKKLPAGTRRAIVKFRFLDGMSCRAIAVRLHYSRSYIYKALLEGIRAMAADQSFAKMESVMT